MIGRLLARSLRPLALTCGVLLTLGLAACGKVADPSSAENDGVYVQAGPITYQLEISRQISDRRDADRMRATANEYFARARELDKRADAARAEPDPPRDGQP